MTGSIAPNRPGHHGTVVARTVGTVAISCNGPNSNRRMHGLSIPSSGGCANGPT